jgi:hypothetical protein
LKLNSEIPLDLTLYAGAYQGDMDLGGMNITHLKVNDGASDTKIKFSKPNSGSMDLLEYNSGASNVSLSGLGNANFKEMTFTAGAGNYTMDFSGELQQDANVRIDAGVSAIKVIIPQGTHAVVSVDGELKDVNTRGTWTVESDTYSTNGSGKELRIHINMNLGSLDLVQQ